MFLTLDIVISADSDSFIAVTDDTCRFTPNSAWAVDPRLGSHNLRFARLKYSRMVGEGVYPLAKRTLDVVVAATLLLTLAPLYALLAVVIKATDGGTVLFWQTRVGRWGQEFRFPKFRSMVPDADSRLHEVLVLNQHKTGVTFKLKNDPRLTRIGRLMRRTSLDELPQLWSVLAGDMTLVGPRPAVPREVSLYTLDDRQRLEVAPGLTCIWQVSGRSDVPFARQLKMDLEYIERRSLALDLKLLALTVPAVLSGRGAY